MINPTPVHTKSSPYRNAPTRSTLPRSIAATPSSPPTSSRSLNWKRLFILSFVVLIGASGTYAYAQFNSLKNSIIIQHEGESSSILSYDLSGDTKINAGLFKKAGDGRFNVLIVGVGGANHPGGNLTDSIQVMSVDTLNKKVGMTSIPRDLYVNVPNYGYSKINGAYQIGEQKKAGEGAYLMRQVVGNVLGINISNFVLIDFAGAKQLVDVMGGIDVNVPNAIYDPYFPDDNTIGYSPFSIKAGQQHMNGVTALRYARSRETTSDFDRSARQQIIIAALKKKALSAGTLANPAKVSGILDALGQHIKTDMQPDEIKKFISIYRDIPNESTTSQVLDTSAKLGLLTSSSSGVTGYISYPVLGYGNFSEVQAWFQKNNPDPLLIRDNPTVTVVAGTGTTAKQVESLVATLKDYGYKAQVGTLPTGSKKYTQTVLADTTNGKKEIARNYLNTYLGVTATKDSPLKSGSDFEIIYVPTKK